MEYTVPSIILGLPLILLPIDLIFILFFTNLIEFTNDGMLL